MFVKLLLVGLLACVHSINSASAPFVTKCKSDDSKCMRASAQAAIPLFAAGIPALRMKTLDPFFMKKLDASSGSLKLVLNDITGTGLKQCEAKRFGKAQISVDVDLGEVTGPDGEKHWTIKGNKHTYELKEKATIELENLLKGNELLGGIARDLIAGSPNEIIAEVGPPIVAAVVDVIVGEVNNFFSQVPMKDLVDY